MDELDDVDTPNCAKDLVPMQAIEVNETVVWKCPECGLIKLYATQ